MRSFKGLQSVLRAALLSGIPAPCLFTTAVAATLYVDVNSTNPVPPYANWQTAAANIQDATVVARRGDTVLVGDGIYNTGSRVSPDGTTNRVSLVTAITLQSVNGATATVIDGGGALRCVYLCDGAVLSGFTFTNGNVASAPAPNGGGVCCASTNVLVSNCILVNNTANSGGGAFSGTLTNCLLLANTANAGGGAASSALYSCVLSGNMVEGYYLNGGGGGANGCMLSNCIVTNNVAHYNGGGLRGGTANNCLISSNIVQGYEGYGGGAWDGATLYNCTLSGNSAYYGGGAEAATLVNCLVISNTAFSGGGAYGGTLINCTVTGNTSGSGFGGGATSTTVENSILYYNFGPTTESDDQACALTNSCTPTATGAGNLTNAPAFDSAYHLLAGSPCIDAGSNAFVTAALDLAGNLRIINGRVDMGAFEYHFASPLTVSMQANYTNMVVGYPVQFSGTLNGGRSACWTFGDGTVISNMLAVSHAWNAVGDYPVTFTVYDDNYPSGVSASVLIHVTAQPFMYVDPGCTNPVAPFSSWDTAATNIQDAIDAAGIGCRIIVTNGTYQPGGRVVFGSLANRVAVNKPLVVQSVNGASVTTIQGSSTLGNTAVRCVYLNSNAVLIGFTLSNGGTRTAGDGYQEQSGGALYCESTNSLIANCIISTSSAANVGGGVYQGTLTNCTITGCLANYGGGAYGGRLSYCTVSGNSVPDAGNPPYVGGGVYGCILDNCTLSGNSAPRGGGGACSSTLNSCALSDNRANSIYSFGGGAAYSCNLNGCTLSGNSANWYGAATALCNLTNCVMWQNSNGYGGADYGGTLSNCRLFNNGNGGAYQSTLINCILMGNSRGGASRSTLINCIVVGNNNVNDGGGATSSTLQNCIIQYNSSVFGPANYDSSDSLNYCCAAPLPPSGVGNIATDPLFVNYGAGDLHLQTNSPCVEAGNNSYVTLASDFDGNPRIIGNNVDIGAYEFQAPTFLSRQPQSQTNYAEYTTVFTSAGVSPLPFTYQWQFNGTSIGGATSSTLTISNTQPSNAGSYGVVISNALVTAQSSDAMLTVISPPPALLSQPLDLITNLGSNAVFSVSAFSAYPISYQWQRDNTNLSDGGPMGGTTNSSLVIAGAQFSDAANYRVVVTNKYGAVTSSIASLTVLGPPVLFSQPADTVAMVADFTYLTLSMGSTGAPPLTVQWQKNGTNILDDGRITGSSSSTLTIAMQQPMDSGVYSVVVSNAYGSISSTNARIVVAPLLRWLTWPATPPMESTNFIEIATGSDALGGSGGSFNLGLSADGTVTEWNYALPPPAEATNAVAIAAGSYFGLALRKDGTVVGWGENSSGQSAPPADLTNAVAISAGTRHSLALLRNGTVSAWGDSTYGETNAPLDATNIVAIAAGADFNLALRQDGKVLAWGRNDASQTNVPPDVTNVVAIAAGSSHAVALRADGSITGWGQAWSAPPARATNAMRLAAGDGHNLALLRDGTVVGWGRSDYAQTFITPGLTNVVSISANELHSMAMVQHDTTPSAGPSLVQQPLDLTLLRGASGAMRAYAVGSSPLSYQWFFNGVAVAGETNCWLWLNGAQPPQAGGYQVVATNNYGAVTSVVAVVTELPWAVIAAQPASQAAILNNNATFSVGMYGAPPFYYQWLYNGMPLADNSHFSGTASGNLIISNVQSTDAGIYSVVVTNASNAVTSAPALLTILFPAAITNQPASASVLITSNAVFTVGATGTGTLTYQWARNGTNLNNGGGIAGATSPTLTISGAQTSDSGPYQAIVSNDYGTTTSTVATLTVYLPVQITAQPSSAAVIIGSNASFAVAASGTALGYQWFLNSTPLVDDARISGSATPSLAISNVQATDVGGYWVIVSNLLTSARSMTASLTPLVSSNSSVRYVDPNSPGPSPPYLGWSTAATNIQDAIDAAVDGDLLLVTNGLYRTGGRVVYGSITNRLVVYKALVVQSVNGPAATVIEGASPAADTAVRCVYLTNNASLIGFTLTNGAARSAGDLFKERSGGGVWCESTNCLVVNCLFISNSVTVCGGGVFSGTSSNCSFAYNSAATNGGACFGGVLTSCTLVTNRAINGGGAYSNNLNACTLIGNFATNNGGGTFGGVLTSCTLTANRASNGGGAYSNTLSACTLIANSATSIGGGAYGTRLINCTVALNTNASHGGGLHSCVGTGCTISNNVSTSGYGGGGYNSFLTNCTVLGNAAIYGGGAFNSSLNSCTISGNRASGSHGGAGYGGAFNNCLICSNSAPFSSGVDSGVLTNCTIVGHTNGSAVYNCTVYNSILYYNTNNWSSTSFRNCCTFPLPSGSGNITNAPLFADLATGNLHLQNTSPCINAGTNAYAVAATDLDGLPRVVAGTVDVGAYECQSPALLDFFLWMQSYGLPTAAWAIYADADNDGMNNWQEWVAGTNPTNAASALRLQMPLMNPPGLLLRWTSDTNCAYFVQRATSLNLPPSFTTLRGDIPGLPGITTYIDTNALASGRAAFYRVGTSSTNAHSPVVLQQPTLVPATVTLTWSSVTNRAYFIQRATSLAPIAAFYQIQTNIPGLADTTSFTDTNPVPIGAAFYRVGVQQ